MKKNTYINIENILKLSEFKNFKLFSPSSITPKNLILDDHNTDLERYIVGSHPVYSAINGDGRIVVPHSTKHYDSELDQGKNFSTGAYSKSTRTRKDKSKWLEHRIRCNGIFNTISTGHGGAFQSSLNVIRFGNKLRYLTPLECERLMSWPDYWTKYGKKENGEIYELSDSERYHLCGNGIVSEVPRIITSRITEKIKIFSTFSGADGSCLGLNDNFETVGFSEFDTTPSNLLRYQYPDLPNLGDITQIDIKKVPEFDLLFVSAPCQTFSKGSRNRAGFNDARGTLFFEAAKIIKERKPKYILFENVKDMINHDGGRTFEIIMRTFVELGYGGEVNVLNASHYGVPQARERVFILAHRL